MPESPESSPSSSSLPSPDLARARVALQRCADTSPKAIHAAVRAAFTALPNIDALLRPGRRVFLKVNLVSNATREEAICTDPEVVRAAVIEVRARGATPVIGDNPAIASEASVLRASGIGAIAAELGVETPDMGPTATLKCARAERFDAFEVSKAILDADVLLNLPKLKTHTLTYMSMAVKNLFGLIPGIRKARWHVRAPHADLMAILLNDLYGGVADHFAARGGGLLHLCDGVNALEGDGPGHGGRPRFLGAILASTDAMALDRVGCEVAGLDPECLVTLPRAWRRPLGKGERANTDRVEIVGATIADFAGVRLVPPTGGGFKLDGIAMWLGNQRWLRDLMIEHPRLTADQACIGCRRCAEICPADAIRFSSAALPVPVFDKRPCIRCYCCAEVCPKGAIEKSPLPWLGRLFT
ncbi:MAG: DUF362 domain-containing protein [Myxococcales bacterium]|nr:DUF362 domain-containing protein [Myxococcales bacterium]